MNNIIPNIYTIKGMCKFILDKYRIEKWTPNLYNQPKNYENFKNIMKMLFNKNNNEFESYEIVNLLLISN